MPLLLRTVSEPVTGTVAGAAETPGFVPKPRFYVKPESLFACF
jgi:hypothetical protein